MVAFLLTCFLVTGPLVVFDYAYTTATERLANYFRAELAVTNTAVPVQAAVTTVATRDEGNATVTSQRFLPKTPETFTHDDDGNLTSDGRWENVWDAENRLVQQTASAAAVAAGAPNQRLTFAYDHAGRRIQKTVAEWDGSGWMQIYSLNFLYDGWHLAAEVAANGGPVLRSYAWGADLSGGDAAGGIGGLAFIRFHIENKTVAVAADGQGNTSALYDMEDAALQGSYEYGPFGEPLRASGPFAAVNPFRFSTKYEDPESGWLYFGYRYYTPATGRWASQDPIGEAGGINLRAFVGNDPVNWVDPLGLEAVIIVERIAGNRAFQRKYPGSLALVYERGKFVGETVAQRFGYKTYGPIPAVLYHVLPKPLWQLEPTDLYGVDTPSITSPNFLDNPGQVRTDWENIRIHPEGSGLGPDSDGCLTVPQEWADRITDIMLRNLDDGGTIIIYKDVEKFSRPLPALPAKKR